MYAGADWANHDNNENHNFAIYVLKASIALAESGQSQFLSHILSKMFCVNNENIFYNNFWSF